MKFVNILVSSQLRNHIHLAQLNQIQQQRCQQQQQKQRQQQSPNCNQCLLLGTINVVPSAKNKTDGDSLETHDEVITVHVTAIIELNNLKSYPQFISNKVTVSKTESLNHEGSLTIIGMLRHDCPPNNFVTSFASNNNITDAQWNTLSNSSRQCRQIVRRIYSKCSDLQRLLMDTLFFNSQYFLYIEGCKGGFQELAEKGKIDTIHEKGHYDKISCDEIFSLDHLFNCPRDNCSEEYLFFTDKMTQCLDRSSMTVIQHDPNELLQSHLLREIISQRKNYPQSTPTDQNLYQDEQRIDLQYHSNFPFFIPFLFESLENTHCAIKTSLRQNQLYLKLSQSFNAPDDNIVCHVYEWKHEMPVALFDLDLVALSDAHDRMTRYLDIFIGFTLTLLLMLYIGPSNWFDMSMNHAVRVVDQVERLLNSLMGMPVGLKLNPPLNQAMGKFFLYHIYLWRTFVTLIRPLLAVAIHALTLTGLLGLSFLLSVGCGLFALITIHIYCFYGYAARFYNLQIRGLIALWRLFRGKKWNLLRHRVDSHSYGTDQLFVGTISFTILFFLVPTVLTYYLVFFTLHLVTRLLQDTLKYIYYLLTGLPIYTIILWLANSKKVASQVRLLPITSMEGSENLVANSIANKQTFVYLTSCIESLETTLVMNSQLHSYQRFKQKGHYELREKLLMFKPLQSHSQLTDLLSFECLRNKLLMGEIF